MIFKPSLLQIVVKDLLKHKFTILIAVAVVVSAFSVILATHETRLMTAKREMLRGEKDKLDIEWRNLLLEQNALVEHSRIRRIANEQLNMHRATGKFEQVVELP
ncbi:MULTISPECIES: cell division protein FtsL [unclassified Motilimonas]|uniref:cell division protein FtsL n=1 Tax=Motilimonas TaxID=1914248 RepID=UPI001E30E6B9|nr:MULTISPECIES: cell division protein FtsL [unclassified Motilimonas]MCE0555752.1 cell division protein FtsL [Motilimonas sp. E26]MDO6524199.1 cell division protein FtsL [Motilimonas sp. 1_MG-2023]